MINAYSIFRHFSNSVKRHMRQFILRQKKNFNSSKGRSKKKAEDESEAKVQTNTTAGACCDNQLAAEASAGAWRFSERTAVAVNLRQHRRRQLLRGNGREWFLERGCRFCSRTLLQQNVVSQTERTK
jgi:hypothetical protein